MRTFALIFVLIGLGWPGELHAKGGGLQFAFSPRYGQEWIHSLSPDSHHVGRAVWGALLTAGFEFMEFELEFLRGVAREERQSVQIKDAASQLKLGGRGKIRLSSSFGFHVRGGLQIQRTQHEESSGPISTVNPELDSFRGYVGGGLNFILSRHVEFPLSFTFVMTGEDPDSNPLSRHFAQRGLRVFGTSCRQVIGDGEFRRF